ncbi:MAG: tail fiber domain-containing protein, partial [Saprospiraceae bacterium]|nr:tail fiber domain-containing protein [Saprospiraceae bacterium]
MKNPLISLLVIICFINLQAQTDPLAEIEGRLSIYRAGDNTSVHIGKDAGVNQMSTSTQRNTFVGFKSGEETTTGTENAFFGNEAGRLNDGGIYNSFFGCQAGESNQEGEENSFFGAFAGQLNNLGMQNSFFGSQAGIRNAGGSKNTFVGSESGSKNTSGFNNSFFGAQAGYKNIDGKQNVAMGAFSFHTNRTASWNVAIGDSSMYFLEGDFDDYPHRNVAIGAGSLIGKNEVLSQNSVAIGYQAGYEGGDNSIFLGYQAGKGVTSLENKLYISNKAGENPLIFGDFNGELVRINGRLETLGQIVLENESDIVFKKSDGISEKAVLTLNTNNDTYLDGERHLRFRTSMSPNERMIIKENGDVGIGTTNPLYLFQVGQNGDGSEARANAWNTFSDKRWKWALKPLKSTMENLNAITGYYYHWKEGLDKSRQIGFMAQEIQAVYPEIVSEDSDGYLSVDYT